jgi:uncharacterized protein YdhG (YjbR/CyaY superfamily)
MKINSDTVENYIASIDPLRKEAFNALRATIIKSLPKGLEECISYNMIGYVVPHSIYPNGYHCNPELPLPFISIAAQKNFIALYHMGIYADKNLLDWFITNYPLHAKSKLDMGKSCIRFKKVEDMPLKLIEELLKKMSVKQWIVCYDKLKPQKK